MNGERSDGPCCRQHCIVRDLDYAISVPSLSKTPEEGKRSHFFSVRLETRSGVGHGRERAAYATPAVRASVSSRSAVPRLPPLAAMFTDSSEAQSMPAVPGTVSDVHVDAVDRDRHRSRHCSDTPPLPNPLVAYASRSRWFSRPIDDQASDAFHLLRSLATAKEEEMPSYMKPPDSPMAPLTGSAQHRQICGTRWPRRSLQRR